MRKREYPFFFYGEKFLLFMLIIIITFMFKHFTRSLSPTLKPIWKIWEVKRERRGYREKVEERVGEKDVDRRGENYWERGKELRQK